MINRIAYKNGLCEKHRSYGYGKNTLLIPYCNIGGVYLDGTIQVEHIIS